MEAQKRACLVVGTTEHYLDLVLKVAAAGPKISVKVEDIVSGSDINFEVAVIAQELPTLSRETIFFMREGKYLILFGTTPPDGATGFVKGRLISTQALKRCRVSEAADAVDKLAQYATKPSTGFSNTPRIIDKRASDTSARSEGVHGSLEAAKATQSATVAVKPTSGEIIDVKELRDIKPGMKARHNGKLMERNLDGALFDCTPKQPSAPKPRQQNYYATAAQA